MLCITFKYLSIFGFRGGWEPHGLLASARVLFWDKFSWNKCSTRFFFSANDVMFIYFKCQTSEIRVKYEETPDHKSKLTFFTERVFLPLKRLDTSSFLRQPALFCVCGIFLRCFQIWVETLFMWYKSKKSFLQIDMHSIFLKKCCCWTFDLEVQCARPQQLQNDRIFNQNSLK